MPLPLVWFPFSLTVATPPLTLPFSSISLPWLVLPVIPRTYHWWTQPVGFLLPLPPPVPLGLRHHLPHLAEFPTLLPQPVRSPVTLYSRFLLPCGLYCIVENFPAPNALPSALRTATAEQQRLWLPTSVRYCYGHLFAPRNNLYPNALPRLTVYCQFLPPFLPLPANLQFLIAPCHSVRHSVPPSSARLAQHPPRLLPTQPCLVFAPYVPTLPAFALLHYNALPSSNYRAALPSLFLHTLCSGLTFSCHLG